MFSERKRFVVSRKHGSGGRKRIFLAENGVGSGNGGFADRVTHVHIAEVDDAENAARKRPRGGDERVVIVRVTVDYAPAEMGKIGNGFGFKEVEKLFGERAALRILEMGKNFASPERAGEIPLKFAVRGGMGEIEEGEIDFGEKTAKRSEEFGRMGFGFGKGDARKKGEEPHQAAGAVFSFDTGEELTLKGGNHARKSEMRGALGKMSESSALHVHEGFFPGGMHDLKDEGAGAGGEEMKIIVVLAGKGARGGVKAVEIKGDARSLRESDGRSDAGFGHHAENCNGGKSGWANGERESGMLPTDAARW